MYELFGIFFVDVFVYEQVEDIWIDVIVCFEVGQDIDCFVEGIVVFVGMVSGGYGFEDVGYCYDVCLY